MYTPYTQRTEKSRGYTPFLQRTAQSIGNVAQRFIPEVVKPTGEFLKETAKAIPKIPVSLAMIPADVASTAITGKPLPPLKLPLVGEVKSYGRKAIDYANEPGYTPITAGLRAASEGILDVAIAGGLAQSLAREVPSTVIGRGRVFTKQSTTPSSQFTYKDIGQNFKYNTESALRSSGNAKLADKIARLDLSKVNSFDDIVNAARSQLGDDFVNPEVVKWLQTFKGLSSRASSPFLKPNQVSETIKTLVEKPDTLPLFRGENITNKGGIHFTTDKAWTETFGGEKLTGTLPKNAKVLPVSEIDVQQAIKEGAKNETEIWQKFFDKGYDAIVGTDPMNSAKIDVIVNPKHLQSFTKVVSKATQTLETFGPVAKIATENVQNFLKKAYQVYSGQKGSAIVAKIADDVAKETKYPKDVVVQQAFFDKLVQEHPEIPSSKLFEFVNTLNLKDSEIFNYPFEQKLKFFRTLENEFVNFVAIGKDYTKEQMNVITHFITDKAKWISNAKSTGEPVPSATLGRTPNSPSLPQREPPAGGLISGVKKPKK